MNALIVSFLGIILAPFGAIVLGSSGIGLTESMAIGAVVALAGIAVADYGSRSSRPAGRPAHAPIALDSSGTRQPTRIILPGVARRRQHSAALEVA